MSRLARAQREDATPPVDRTEFRGSPSPDEPGRIGPADSALVRGIERATPHVPWAARERLRHVLRQYGQVVGAATASQRALPDFLIIGAKRSGTTMLLRYLQQHPLVAPPFPARQAIKGVRYFDHHYPRGEAWYRRHFVTRRHLERLSGRAGHRALTGEASPYYLYHPLAAERVSRDLPQARLLVMLRNPVARAYSHYKKNQELFGNEPLSFEEALAAEDHRLAGEEERMRHDPSYISIAHEHHAYATQGDYLRYLRPWLEHFPGDQVLVCQTEDLQAEPVGVMDRVMRFLDLPPIDIRAEQRRLNATSETPIAPAAEQLLHDRFAPLLPELTQQIGHDLPWNL